MRKCAECGSGEEMRWLALHPSQKKTKQLNIKNSIHKKIMFDHVRDELRRIGVSIVGTWNPEKL